jgi:predicted amidohydrolase
MKLNVALAQIDPTLGDVSRNVDMHLRAAKQAAGRGASLVVFPELSLTGYSIKDMNWDLALNIESGKSDVLQPLLKLSNRVSMLVGGVEEDGSFRMYNSAFFIEDGSIRTVHRKLYPPTYGMFEEMRYFSRGQSVHAFETKHGRLGAAICEDLWHPSVPYLLAQDGALAILALVASPTRIGPGTGKPEIAKINLEHYKTYSRLFSTYLIFCNRVGYEDGVNFWGGSAVVSPNGEVIAEARLFEEEIIVTNINEEEVRRARRFSRHFHDEDLEIVSRELNRIKDQR